MAAPGQNRLSATIPAMSVTGKKRRFLIFIQNSIHRMSVIGGKSDEVFSSVDFRFVPVSDILDRLRGPTIVCKTV